MAFFSSHSSKGKLKLRFAPQSISIFTRYTGVPLVKEWKCGLAFFFSFLEEALSSLLCALCVIISSGVCAVADRGIILQKSFLVWVSPVGLGPHGAVHGRSGMHDCVGRDIFQHLHCAALGFCPKFSCQLCIFPAERAVQPSCERKHRVFGMGWLHLQSVGMNVFAGGKLEPVAARPLFLEGLWKISLKLVLL